MSNCLFCNIVAGEIPAKKIYEDNQAIAFLDISPWQDGHALVVPRRHVRDVLADQAVLSELGPAVQAVGSLLKRSLGATACNVVSNAGADAGQEVFHAHVHVVPRYAENPGLENLRSGPVSDVDEVFRAISAEM